MIPGTLKLGDDPNPEIKPFTVLGALPRLIEPPDGWCNRCIYRRNLCRECLDSGDFLPCEHPLKERLDNGEVREI